MITRVPEISPEESAKIIRGVIGRKSTTQDYADSEQNVLLYNRLLEEQKELDEEGTGKKAASDEVWAYAWKQKEEYYRLKNAPKESHSSPAPLLMDKASTLPAGAPERIQVETTKSTIDNTTSNVGNGMDSLTRESYKETKRLVKSSEMLQQGIREPLPKADQITGEEEGTIVSNLQNWQPAFANAVKPVSDATGSHSDMASSVAKSPMGPSQFLPSSCAAIVDNITPNFTNELDVTSKAIYMDGMQHMPSKMAGSTRHLSTANDPLLSIPHDMASDVYNGLLRVMDEIANLGDVVMTGITRFALSPIGGLVNGVFPASQLKNILGPVGKLAGQIGGLNQLLGGFSALTQITKALGGITSSLTSILGDPTKLSSLMAAGANIAGIVGGLAGKSLGCVGGQLNMKSKTAAKIGKILTTAVALNTVLGAFSGNVRGLGNLGVILGKVKNKNLGKLISNLRHPEQIINGLLPPELSKVLQELDKLCNVGMVGNAGYSVGSRMDSIGNSSYSSVMSTHAAHESILGPLFNKKAIAKGAYAQNSSLDFFTQSPFVAGAQGNKGITMHSPGATISQKSFGITSELPSLGMSQQQIDDQIKANLTPAQYASYKQQMNQLDADIALNQARVAESRRQAGLL